MKNMRGPFFRPFPLFVLLAGVLLGAATESEAAKEEVMEAELRAIRQGDVDGSPVLAGLQLLVMRDGEVAYEHAGGYARLADGAAEQLNMDHKPRIASISKLVAALGLMRLVEDGRADLDTDVSHYLGFALRNPAFPDRVITLRMVLSHTSSIRDGAYYWLESGQRFEDFFRPNSPHWNDGAHFASGKGQAPGRYFAYANLNFGVVAAVIERLSGERFDRYMRLRVLEPLGLQASYNVCDLSATHPEWIATLYRKRDDNEVWRPAGEWVPQLDDRGFSCHYGREPVGRGEPPGPVLPGYVPGENPTLFSPQGGLRASVRDLAALAGLLLNGGRHDGLQLIDRALVKKMFEPQWVFDPKTANGDPGEGPDAGARRLFSAFGLSVHIADTAEWGMTAQPRTLYGHLGGAYGMIGQFWLDPEHGDVLIALTTGPGDDPDRQPGTSPLHRPNEEIMRWWLRHFPR